ncbi:hypothetical protein ACFFRR_009065 [Megaselia abdita]
MNKFQKKTWSIVTFNLRLAVPLILHMLNISVVDFYTNSVFKMKTDVSTLLFCMIVNTVVGCIPHLLPAFYRPKNVIKEGIIYIFLQIALSELCFRVFVIPIFYVLHFICIEGHLSDFIDKYFFVIYSMDSLFYTKKLVKALRTEQGYEWVSIALPVSIILVGLQVIGIITKVRHYLHLTFWWMYLWMSAIVNVLKLRPVIKKVKARYQQWCLSAP